MSKYLSRADWGAVPAVKSLPVSKNLKGVCLHYMGFTCPEKDPERLARSIQRNHMGKPKGWWDIAYNELIALDGTVLEGRGMMNRCGANGSTKHNKEYIAIGLLIGDDQEPSPEMIEAVKERVQLVRFFQSQATQIVGHCDLKATRCPEKHVMALIKAGSFEPTGKTVPAIQQIPTLEERITSLEEQVQILEGKSCKCPQVT